ncbi:hypothetical protein SAMN04487912_101132 [Arthrobacter sp. cf158]|nr:hypothetical protein SAMN04487912_101132 [Arthrobacter sp. cf158]
MWAPQGGVVGSGVRVWVAFWGAEWAPHVGGVCCGARFTPLALAEGRSVGLANGGCVLWGLVCVFVVGPGLRPFPWLRRAVWAPHVGGVCCVAWFAPFSLAEGRSVGPANGGCLLWGLVCVFGWGFGAQCGPRKRALPGGHNNGGAAPKRGAPPSNVLLVAGYLWLLTGWTSGGNSSETAPATRLSQASRTAGSVGGVSSEITTYAMNEAARPK